MRAVALAAAMAMAFALPASAQRRSIGRTTLVALDVIGPRTRASVRAALRAHERDLDACRPDEDAALVVVSFHVAPDGSVLSATAGEDEELDRDTTDCVLGLATSWRFPAQSAEGVTAVTWSFRLPRSAGVICWCHSWVHGRAFGRTCTRSLRSCERARVERGLSGESMSCRDVVMPACESRGDYVHERSLPH